MKKKTYLRHIWMLLDTVNDKVENLEAKIDLLKSDDIEYNAQKLKDLIADSDENKKEIMEIKSMILTISNQITAKETKKEVKEEPKAETPVVEEKKEEVKEPEEKKAPAKKAPTKKSTTKKAPAKK